MKSGMDKFRRALIYWAEQKSNFKTEHHHKDFMPVLTLIPIKTWWSKFVIYEIFRWEIVALVREGKTPFITLYSPNKEIERFLSLFRSESGVNLDIEK